jgi:hypothetical protein
MAKKKSMKKEETLIENVEKEVVSFENKDIETVDELIEEITPIDITKELEELKQEIFNEEKSIEEEMKQEIVEEVVVEEPKTNKNNFKQNIQKMFGFVWNGMEYDN